MINFLYYKYNLKLIDKNMYNLISILMHHAA